MLIPCAWLPRRNDGITALLERRNLLLKDGVVPVVSRGSRSPALEVTQTSPTGSASSADHGDEPLVVRNDSSRKTTSSSLLPAVARKGLTQHAPVRKRQRELREPLVGHVDEVVLELA